jgi:hypothetical protein
MFLFERIEGVYDEFTNIVKQIDFLLNSFCRNQKITNGFGINIWNIDTEELKELLIQTETRVIFHNVYFDNNQILIIEIEYGGNTYELRRTI